MGEQEKKNNIKEEKGNNKNSFKEVIRKIIFFISLCVFLYSAFNLFLIVRDYYENYKYYSAIQKEYGPTLVDDNLGKRYVMDPIKFDELKEKNNDFKGWITVENTTANYPIMQSDDNEYYLEHCLDKYLLTGGSIFLGANNNDDFNDRNTTIHGHHMKNGSMFGQLYKYKWKGLFSREYDFFNNNKIVYISTRDHTYEYEIFSVYVEKVSNAPYKNRFEKDEDYLNFLKGLKEKSLVQNDDIKEFTPNDKIVTLSTCDYSMDDGRLLIHAKLIKSE